MPTDGLRVLVAELRSLVDRLELKERSHNLQSTLKTAEQRLAGPRAVVMLLSEHEELKRRFLERLLGPKLTQVPKPTTACIRLEYGIAPECSVSMPLGLTAAETPGPDDGDDPAAEPDTEERSCADRHAGAGEQRTRRDHVEIRRRGGRVDSCAECRPRFKRSKPDAVAPIAGQRGRLEIVVENADALSNEERWQPATG